MFSLQGCFVVCLLKQFGCMVQQEMSFCRSQWQKLDAFLLQSLSTLRSEGLVRDMAVISIYNVAVGGKGVLDSVN